MKEKKKLTQKELDMRQEMRRLAEAIAKERGHDPAIRQHVVALIQSLDDTLSDEFVLEELKALKEGGPIFSEVFADNSYSSPRPSNNGQ